MGIGGQQMWRGTFGPGFLLGDAVPVRLLVEQQGQVIVAHLERWNDTAVDAMFANLWLDGDGGS